MIKFYITKILQLFQYVRLSHIFLFVSLLGVVALFILGNFQDKVEKKIIQKKPAVVHKFKLFTKAEKIQMLDTSFKKYKKLTSPELQGLWIRKFYNSTYRSGGNSSFKKYDCIHGVFHFLWGLGSEAKIADIPSLKKSYDQLALLGKTKIRRRYSNVELGDIVIFKPYRGPWHMGLVTRLVNGRVCISDINPFTNMGIERSYKFGGKFHNHTPYIYKMSWDIWVGESLR